MFWELIFFLSTSVYVSWIQIINLASQGRLRLYNTLKSPPVDFPWHEWFHIRVLDVRQALVVTSNGSKVLVGQLVSGEGERVGKISEV